MDISIRQISEADAEAVADLSDQLGYHLSVAQILANIRAVAASKDNEAFAAVHAGQVVGWIGVSKAIELESTPFCEIRGLVVDSAFRRRGVGKLLVAKAKQWSHEQGTSRLRVRCNTKRKETHLFYRHLNFREVKEQKIFDTDT